MTFVQEVVAVAENEWDFFGKDVGQNSKYVDGKRKETVSPYFRRIGDYWLSIPSDEYDRLVKRYAKTYGKLDGTVDLPWSAAFISYVMQMAGAGPQFPYSGGHVRWIRKSIANRQSGKTSASLVGYRVDELPLEVGDLVGAPRGNSAHVTYDTALANSWFQSHSDLIVRIDPEKRKAYAIGGNVGQSVGLTELSITADGRLNDTSRPWIVHIRNNITAALVAAAEPEDELVLAG